MKNPLKKIRQNMLASIIVGFLAIGAVGAGLKYLEADAKKAIAERKTATPLKPVNEGLMAKVNPFLPAPSPTATPQLSKEYIYAGSRLLAVEDANANAAPPADLAVWRPSTGTWWVHGGQGSQQMSQTWGTNGDIAVPGDYDGDGKTDFCVFRASSATWFVYRSSDSGAEYYYFGTTGDIPAQADFDGDGKTDAAVFRPSNGTWYIRNSSSSQLVSSQFGQSGDKPVARDYDGDGKADLAFWRQRHTDVLCLPQFRFPASKPALRNIRRRPGTGRLRRRRQSRFFRPPRRKLVCSEKLQFRNSYLQLGDRLGHRGPERL